MFDFTFFFLKTTSKLKDEVFITINFKALKTVINLSFNLHATVK